VRRANQILQLGAKASKRLPQAVIAAALDMEDVDEHTGVEGGLFPDLIAGQSETEEEVDALPLLNSKTAGQR